MHKILCLTSGLESIVYRITVASFGADWCNGGLSSISMVLILETVSMKGKCVPGIVVEVYFCYANTRFCPEIQFPECLVGYKHGHHGLWSCLQSTDYTHLDQITTKTGYCIHTRTHAHTHANTHTQKIYIQCIHTMYSCLTYQAFVVYLPQFLDFACCTWFAVHLNLCSVSDLDFASCFGLSVCVL